jgi:hypothetical protein
MGMVNANASLVAGAALAPAAKMKYGAQAGLTGGSTFVDSSFKETHFASASIQGGAAFQATAFWTPHPGAPPPPPAINSGATLAQFIQSLGVGRGPTKTPPANNTTVDTNPPRRPTPP